MLCPFCHDDSYFIEMGFGIVRIPQRKIGHLHLKTMQRLVEAETMTLRILLRCGGTGIFHISRPLLVSTYSFDIIERLTEKDDDDEWQGAVSVSPLEQCAVNNPLG